jgi:uncharacterized protein YbjT (DUF2867 family)
MSRTLLVAGATGKQGGAVVRALLSDSSKASNFTVLAVTRNVDSAGAGKLTAKYPSIKLVQGDLDDVPALFQNAKKVTSQPIWGVFSVQPLASGNAHDKEQTQGIALIDESLKQGVEHFVYSSVERGGDEKSWQNPTPVPHFISKHNIEQHLKETAGNKMGWTILRPVAFMDNFAPNFPTKVFLAALRDTLGEKKLQLIATKDIGAFAARAFENPQEWNHKAVGLAGDELNYEGLDEVITKTTGSSAGATFGFLGSAFLWAVPEMAKMIQWFKTDGYAADIPKLRKIDPKLLDLKTWLKEESTFETK